MQDVTDIQIEGFARDHATPEIKVIAKAIRELNDDIQTALLRIEKLRSELNLKASWED